MSLYDDVPTPERKMVNELAHMFRGLSLAPESVRYLISIMCECCTAQMQFCVGGPVAATGRPNRNGDVFSSEAAGQIIKVMPEAPLGKGVMKTGRTMSKSTSETAWAVSPVPPLYPMADIAVLYDKIQKLMQLLGGRLGITTNSLFFDSLKSIGIDYKEEQRRMAEEARFVQEQETQAAAITQAPVDLKPEDCTLEKIQDVLRKFPRPGYSINEVLPSVAVFEAFDREEVDKMSDDLRKIARETLKKDGLISKRTAIVPFSTLPPGVMPACDYKKREDDMYASMGIPAELYGVPTPRVRCPDCQGHVGICGGPGLEDVVCATCNGSGYKPWPDIRSVIANNSVKRGDAITQEEDAAFCRAVDKALGDPAAPPEAGVLTRDVCRTAIGLVCSCSLDQIMCGGCVCGAAQKEKDGSST